MPSWHFGAIGTHWTIDTVDVLESGLKDVISSRIEEFDRAYSRFRDDSLVMSLARLPQTVEFPDDARDLFALYRKLYEATGGSLSPLVGATLNHLGYDSSYRLTALPGPPDPLPAFDDVVTLEGVTMTTHRPLTIDVGAVGKGFLVDVVAALLRRHGVTQYTVDASGDIAHAGPAPETIALENPRDDTRAIGVVSLRNQALAASATNRRTWGDGLHHIVDALTGLPTQSVEATFVVADSAAEADGLATALFVADPSDLASVCDFEWVMMMSDGSLRSSQNFPGEVFSK